MALVIGKGHHLMAYRVQWWAGDIVPGAAEQREFHPAHIFPTRELAETHLEAKIPSLLTLCRTGVAWHFPGTAT